MYNEPIWDSISIICCGIGFFILTILIFFDMDRFR